MLLGKGLKECRGLFNYTISGGLGGKIDAFINARLHGIVP